MKNIYLVPVIYLLFAFCCSAPAEDPSDIIQKSIEAHGLDQLERNALQFVFRDKTYTVDRTQQDYVYTRAFEDSLGWVTDSLTNSSIFSRHVDSTRITISEEWAKKYSSSINSVLYFFQVPYILKDQAARKELIGQAEIDGETYYAIKVTFGSENGGEDFEDEYRYWIHSEKYTVDYFAYNYQTDGGGTRFRKAIDREQRGAFTLQNYINYAPEQKFPKLDDLPGLYQNQELKELSRIINENTEIL